jgi:hypothetical protein
LPGLAGPLCQAGSGAEDDAQAAAGDGTRAAGVPAAGALGGAPPPLPLPPPVSGGGMAPPVLPSEGGAGGFVLALCALAALLGAALFLRRRGRRTGPQPAAAPPKRALAQRTRELLTAPLPAATELGFEWWVNLWVRVAATAGAMALFAAASSSAMPLVARPGAHFRVVDDNLALAEASRASARGGGGGGPRVAPCYANPALVNCRRWLDEVLPLERIDIVLFGNELWGQFPLVGYGGIEASVETMAGAMHEMGLPFWVVTPKRVTRPPPRYPFDVLETADNPSGAGGYVPRYVQEGLEILRARRNAAGDNVTLVDDAHGASWRHRRSAPDAPGAPRPLVVWGQSDWSQAFAELALVEVTTHHDGGGPIAGWDRHLPNVGHRFLSKDQRSRWVAEHDVRARARPPPPPSPPPAHFVVLPP